MEPRTYFILVGLFGACNLLLLGLVTAFVITMNRQQQRLQELSKLLEELLQQVGGAVEEEEGNGKSEIRNGESGIRQRRSGNEGNDEDGKPETTEPA